jgi:uncharacterized protein
MIKTVFIVSGTLSLIIGIIGVAVPGIPATPFFLLTAGLYIKSSDRLYRKLTENRIIGGYITDYHKKKGMTKRSKLAAIWLMWGMIAISCIFFIKLLSIRLAVLSAGIIGTVVMGFIVPTVKNSDNEI